MPATKSSVLSPNHKGVAMPRQTEREYYLDRASVERHLSNTASNRSAALVHKQLAERYERLASDFELPRSKLTIVSDNPTASAA
jgi:hypothetical protein